MGAPRKDPLSWAGFPGVVQEFRPTAGSVQTGSEVLLDLDSAAGLFELLLELVGLVALDAFLDGLGGLIDESLGFLEAQAGRRADDLDDLNLLVACGGEDDVDGRGLFLCRLAAAATGGRGCCGNGRSRNARTPLREP